VKTIGLIGGMLGIFHIRQMIDQGAEGIILGCTEIGLLIHVQDSPVPLFDTTHIHAEAAVEYTLK
jgi:aspartate racemase